MRIQIILVSKFLDNEQFFGYFVVISSKHVWCIRYTVQKVLREKKYVNTTFDSTKLDGVYVSKCKLLYYIYDIIAVKSWEIKKK